MLKELIINVFDYKLIKPEDIYAFHGLPYRMYAILSFQRMYFEEPKVFGLDIEIGYQNETYTSSEAIKINCNSVLRWNYARDAFTIMDNGEKIIASDYYAFFDRTPSFEIEYIGISKVNTACKRLSYHETFQNILIDNQSKHLDKDFYILLFNPEYFEVKTLADSTDAKVVPNEQDVQNFLDAFGESYTDVDVVTALTEMILINQLKPEYNKEYFKSKPETMFSTLKTLYGYSFDNGKVVLSLKNGGRSREIKLFTKYKTLEFDQKTRFRQILGCPFGLSEKPKA